MINKETIYNLATTFGRLGIFKSTLELDAVDYLKVEEAIKYDFDMENNIVFHNTKDTKIAPQITINIDSCYIRFICTNAILK